MRGPLRDAINSIHAKGHHNLYIDGGNTIQSFLGQDLIDEMIITRFPFLLGGGAPLFRDLMSPLQFVHVKTEVFVKTLVCTTYVRNR